jgi:hypothetical protein
MVDYANDVGFLQGGLNLSRLNYGLIVLIPKVNEVVQIK